MRATVEDRNRINLSLSDPVNDALYEAAHKLGASPSSLAARLVSMALPQIQGEIDGITKLAKEAQARQKEAQKAQGKPNQARR